MSNKGIHNVSILVVLLLLSCSNNQHLKFQLPNGDEIKQTTIEELGKEKNIHYEQYLGFVLEYRDSLFTQALLMFENNSNVVGADVLNEDKINKLKSQTFESLEFTYTLPDSSKQRDLRFETLIKQKYSDFDEELKLQEGFELRKKGKIYVKATLHTLAIPNYSVIIYPKE